mgnify:FL=1
MKIILLSLLLITFFGSFSLNAQDVDNKTALSLNIGYHQYWGDYDNELLQNLITKDISGGLNLNESLDLNYLFNVGSLDTDDITPGFRKFFYNNNLTLTFNFANGGILKNDAAIQPFIGTGVGATYFNGEDKSIKDGIYFTVPITAGFDIPLSQKFALAFNTTYNQTFSDNIDGLADVNTSAYDAFLITTLGIKVRLGSSDTDGDGVKDKVDACVNTPGSNATNGCPDDDGDGIINSEDLCPDVAGTADNRGCADSDGDSIADFEDACPNIAGISEFNGCADSDGDKIPDGEDLCPEVKGTSATSGCPDDDGDGIKNSVDLCPAFAGTAAFGGCPDSDGDGIIDKEDDCPSLVGIKPNKGCPEVKAEVKAKIDVIFQNLLFATNSANIDPTSLEGLDELVKIMSEDQDLRLSIEGHTDSRGNNEYNLELSNLRAHAVRDYLIGGGVSSDRIKAVGYGETRPLTTNDTAQGRLKNRRVELNISYK